MRLIDADMLREEVYSWGMNDYDPSDFTDAIDDAPTVEAIPIPKDATNGDIIKALFPEVFVTNCKLVDKVGYFNFNEDWWNAPYKGEQRWNSQ